MAIFVSNPTSAAPPPLIGDGQEPTAVESVEGFTEELAAAMLPSGDAANVPAKPAVGSTEDPDKKASDLQILPAEVLKNAVGDANFALAAQANIAATANASQKSEPQLDDPTSLDANVNLQAAELAAANLAAQMSAASVTPVTQVATVPTVQASDAVQGLQVEQSLSSASLGLPQTSVLNTPAQAANSAELNAAQNAKQAKALEAVAAQSNETPLVLNASPEEVQAYEVSPANLSNASRGKSANLANSFQTSSSPDEMAASATLTAPVNAPLSSLVAAAVTAPLTASLASSANAPGSSAVNGTGTALVSTTVSASESSSLPTQVAVNTAPVAQPTDALSVAQNTQAQSVSANAVTSANSQATLSNAKADQPALEESAFQFDAKLSKPEEVSSKGLAVTSAFTDASDPSVLSSATPSASTSSRSRLNAATESDMASGVNASAALPAETSPASTQSLEDLSSSFVSSLVGGPQRPVNTVMDWVSMRAQERPAPVVPHEVRLDSGAVQMEIQKMVRQGGGHVVMELTPPDQSKFTIELKLDERGGALLVVEGVSDSTRTRLEQSAPQLREQFQQMGLELQLDMRQQNQSASSSASNFAGSQEREGRANLATGPSADMPKGLSPRELGASRARETGSNQVYLYA